MGIFDKSITGVSGSGGLSLFDNSPLGQIGNALVNQGISYAKSKAGLNNVPYINAAVNALNGDYVGAFNNIVNSRAVSKVLGGSRYAASNLMAGLSLEEMQRIVLESFHTNHARKNLWLINISDYSASSGLSKSLGGMLGNVVSNVVGKSVGGNLGKNLSAIAGQATKMAIASNPLTSGLNEVGGGITSNFNMLATNLSYTPFSIESSNHNVGAAIVDAVRSAQKAEISITTMDDEQGVIKKWFKQKASSAVHADGTVGVLADSLIQIRVLHAFVSDNTNMNGFEETLIVRPAGVEYEFDRREDGVQEFTLRFEQTDTFI